MLYRFAAAVQDYSGLERSDFSMKVQHEHLIPAPVEAVLAAYRDPEFYVQKLKNSGALSVEILEREEYPDGRVRLKARATERSRVPAFLRKSDVDEYMDENVLNPADRTLTWRITPKTGADKVFLSGRVEFHPDGADRTRIVFHTELEVKIPLIGGKAEKIGLANTEEECARQAEFVRAWVAKAGGRGL